MTKRPAQPTSRIAKMRVASAEQKPSTVDKVRVDPRVAALVVQTYEALSPKNRKLFAQLPTKQMVATAMKLQAAKAKPAKLQKKADAGDGMVYFEIYIADYNLEEDRDSDDPDARIRYEEFMRGHENKGLDALTHAALADEETLRRHIQKALTTALGRNVSIGNEGHDKYDNLVCKFSVNSTEELLKAKDAIESMYGSEGIIDTVTIYAEARSFAFTQNPGQDKLIPFEDLDEWLEDQKATTARTAKAKGKKSAGVKKKAGPGAGRTFVFTGDDRQFRTPNPSIGSSVVPADVMAEAILRGMTGKDATLDIHCAVEDLAVVSYDKVADASDAGFISRITISAADLAEAASELTKHRDASDGPVTKEDLVDSMEGDVEVEIMFNRNVTYGGGWTIPATPDVVEFDADIAECILHFKARTVRDVNAGIESGVFTLSDDMVYAVESLEFDDDDDDFMAEDEDLHQARMARAAKSKKSARTKKTASLKWDDKGQNVWVAENVEVRLSTYSGKPRSMRVSLRIDGRRGNEFRVDVGATTGWEAIDEGPTRAPKTLEDAKALAERWVSAANEQGTLSPSDYKSAKVKATVNTAASAGNSIQLFKNNKAFSHPTAPSEFKSVAEAKRWIESYDTGGTSRWVKEVARYQDGPRTSYHGGPGNAWEIRVTTGSTTAKSARKVKRATSIDYDTIVENYALALWASEFASAVDCAIEDGVLKRAPWSGGDIIEDYCPEMPADYLNAVEQHLGALKSSNPDIPGGAAGIEQDFLAYREATGNDEEKYGFQLSMQHQGHGVGTSDDGDFETAFKGYPIEDSSGDIGVVGEDDDQAVEYSLSTRLKGSYANFTVDATDELSYCLA